VARRYGVKLFFEGKWQTIVVDDFLPCQERSGKFAPLFSQVPRVPAHVRSFCVCVCVRVRACARVCVRVCVRVSARVCTSRMRAVSQTAGSATEKEVWVLIAEKVGAHRALLHAPIRARLRRTVNTCGLCRGKPADRRRVRARGRRSA
jgi:hypothetical protein